MTAPIELACNACGAPAGHPCLNVQLDEEGRTILHQDGTPLSVFHQDRHVSASLS